jgi:thiopeptide-type bacteriocin biosynthesis protein
LINLIYETLEKLVEEGCVQKYFYIRYADPDPHIRLRIQHKEGKMNCLFSIINKWVNKLHHEGIISKVVNDTYMRESVRYGGMKLINHAEDYFYADSKLVMSLLSMQRRNELQTNMDYIGIAFIISALDVFGLAISEQCALLDTLTHYSNYRKDFQSNKKMIMYAVDNADDWFSIRSSVANPEVFDLVNENAISLREYANVIYEADKNGELTSTIQQILLSIIHMFCNRLMGSSTWEQKILALSRHGVRALNGLRQNQQHFSMLLELPKELL